MGDYISREALLSATEGYDWKEGLKTILKRIPAADVRVQQEGGKLMYEVLIAHLRECAKLDTSNNTYTEAANAIEKMSEAYEKLSRHMDDLAALMPRWIPVSESLPEKFENVLVANKRGKHYDIDKGWWNGSFFDRCAKGGYHSVTHWMPLPEPPKED